MCVCVCVKCLPWKHIAFSYLTQVAALFPEVCHLQDKYVIKLTVLLEKVEKGIEVGSSWNVMVYGDAREGKWRGNWRMEWVASTLHTTSEHGVSSITTADVHNSAASSRLKWSPRRFKWTRPFRRKMKSGFCACAIIFQTQSTKGINIRKNVVTD